MTDSSEFTSAASVEIQRFILDGSVAGTAAPAVGPTGSVTVGNTVTIPEGFKSLVWAFDRNTGVDDGSGSTAQLTINGTDYFPGAGPEYVEQGESIQASAGEVIGTPHQFTVTGTARVRLVVAI